MNELIQSVEQRQLRKNPAFREGDRVRVHYQVIEGNRKRTQVFEGVVLRLQGPGARRTFTVRKLSFGVGVERTFPLHSPKIERIEVKARGEVRRAKLYYLRGRIGRAARVRERRDLTPEEVAAMGVTREELEQAEAAEQAEAVEAAEPEATTEAEAPEAEAAEAETPESEAAETEKSEATAEGDADEASAESSDQPEAEAQPDAEGEAKSD